MESRFPGRSQTLRRIELVVSTLSRWQLITTPPMMGGANMSYDLRTLENMQAAYQTPLLRVFRWSRPTVSYGKHQSLRDIQSLIPPGWETIQRPTGGGVVFHDKDLCLSLCWRAGEPPLPVSLKDHYSWIHGVLLQALHSEFDARLANCHDCATTSTEFATRRCFDEPVAFDLLRSGRKIAGGALCRQKNVFLYQGSIQETSPDLESRLLTAFRRAFEVA